MEMKCFKLFCVTIHYLFKNGRQRIQATNFGEKSRRLNF